MKRIIAIGLSALFILSATACGNNSTPSENSPPSNETKATENSTTSSEKVAESDPLDIYKPDPDKVYTIEWLGGYQEKPLSENPKVKLALEEMYNVKINDWFIEPNEYNELLDLRFASGEVPDIIRTLGIVQMNKYIKQDIIMPVGLDVIERYAPDMYGYINEFDSSSWINVTVDHENYGIPRVNIDGKYTYAPMWRKDWLENVGITKIPETLAEAEEAFYKFRDDDPDKNGKKDTYALSNTGLNAVYGAFGIQVDDAQGNALWQEDENGNLVCSAITPAAKEALTLYAKWYKDGLIDPEFITGEAQGGYWAISQDFANGKVGFTSPGNFYHINPPLFKSDSGSRNWRAVVANMATDIVDSSVAADDPKKEEADKEAKNKYIEPFVGYGTNLKGSDGKFGNLMWGGAGDEMITFNAELQKEPDKLGKILQIVNDTTSKWDVYYLCKTMYPFEGDNHYVLDEVGYIGNEDPEIVAEGKAYLESGREDGQGNAFNPISIPQMVKKWSIALYSWADERPQFTTNGIENKLKIITESQSQINDELEKLRKATYISIITGEKPVEYFDEFVSVWNSLGGEKVTVEANEWWDSVK